MIHRRAGRRRGFAIIVAITILALSAAAVIATIALLRTDASRTGEEISQLQLRQLLLAGQDITAAELSTSGSIQTSAVKLPPELSDATLSIRVRPSAPGNQAAQIEAHFEQYKTIQTITYQGHDHQWVLIEAAQD